MAKKPTKPKIREASAPMVPKPMIPEPPDDGEERLTDLEHQDELDRMVQRVHGLEAAIHGACDRDEAFAHGLKRLAFDVSDAMEACADAFETERQRRMTPEQRELHREIEERRAQGDPA